MVGEIILALLSCLTIVLMQIYLKIFILQEKNHTFLCFI